MGSNKTNKYFKSNFLIISNIYNRWVSFFQSISILVLIQLALDALLLLPAAVNFPISSASIACLQHSYHNACLHNGLFQFIFHLSILSRPMASLHYRCPVMMRTDPHLHSNALRTLPEKKNCCQVEQNCISSSFCHPIHACYFPACKLTVVMSKR